jgi:uncharacterized protein YqhQ
MPANEYVREYLQYGGQAIPEGVMMRSPRFFSVACRAPSGEILVRTEAIEKTWIGRQKWLKWPFLRGSLAILDSMALGTRAMRFASKVQLSAADETGQAPPDKIQDGAIGIALFGGLAIGLALFVFLPNLLAEQLSRVGIHSGLYKNLATELIKIVFFIGYLSAIGQMPEIRRVFQYHGAEHKAINTLEALEDLSADNCRAQTRLHPRCGTSFAIIVLLLGLLVFTFVPRYPIPNLPMLLNVVVRVGVEFLILPFIAGIAYELIRFAGKFKNAEFVNVLFFPGLMTQYLTTREPDDTQIEVALTALKAVVAAEKGEAELGDQAVKAAS